MNTPTTPLPTLDPEEELEALLPAYFQGQTTEEETVRVENALRTSLPLQDAAAETLRVMDILQTLPRHTVTRPLRESVHAEMDAPLPLRARLRPLAAAAVFLLMAGGLVWMQASPRPGRNRIPDIPPLADAGDTDAMPPSHTPVHAQGQNTLRDTGAHAAARADATGATGAIHIPSTGHPQTFQTPQTSQTSNTSKTENTRDPASDAAAWLARTQQEDGSWDIEHYGGRRHLAIGVQGLALMALLQDGERHREQVVRAVRHLQAMQNADGSFGGGGARMYNHGIVTLALLQAGRHRLPGDPDGFDSTLAHALAFIGQTQVKDGGWGYFGTGVDASNTAVTAWQILALQEAARQGHIPPDAHALQHGLAFLQHQAGDGRVRYGTALVAQGTDAIPAMTALCLLHSTDPDARQTARNILHAARPRSDHVQPGRLDPYRTWFDGQTRAGDSHPFRHAVARTQIEDGDDAGSIPALTSDWGHIGGTVYATAMNSLAARL